jgi:hypothetical protein
MERRRCQNCSGLLARDNDGTRCSACSTRYADVAPTLPGAFWDRTDIRAAVEARHIGRLFRAYRHAQQPVVPQDALARWVQLTQGQISVIERARRPVTDLERLERWCDALRVPEHLRWFHGPSRGLAENPADDRLDRALRNAATVDVVTVAHLRQRVLDLDQRYDRQPSTALLAEASQLLGHVGTLAANAAGRVIKDLLLVEAEAATLMGQLTWDASQRKDHGTANAYFDRAIRAASAVGDPTAEGYARLRQSYVALYGMRDPQAGLALTDEAARATKVTSNALTGLALLHAAEAHGMLGDARACEHALGQAEDRFARIGASDIAGHLYSPNQFDRLAGSCYLSLGDYARAQRLLDSAARKLRVKNKSGAIVLGNLSMSHLHQGNLDVATATLHRAIDTVELTRGGGGLNVVASVGRELRRWRAEPDVQDVYDRLLSLMAAA